MRINYTKGGKWTTVSWLTVVLPILTMEWIVFKCLYPYPDFFTDSYSYIQTAAQQDAIGYRPVGYSLFLRLVHVFSSSATLVVTLQFLLVQGASVGLVLTLRRWCALKEGVVGVLMGFILLNPVIPYMCNYISSDALFIGLSLIWLTVLTGVLRDGKWWRLVVQVVLLFVIFNVRYVALFYPAVAALTILLARRGWVYGLAGVVASVGVVVACTLWIKAITKKETGADVFSAFSGWQIANNALNIYEEIPVDTVGLPSAECRELAGDVQRYFASRKPVLVDDTTVEKIGAAETKKEPAVTTAYMWVRSSPLHVYLRDYKVHNRLGYFDAWNRVGVIYSQYGYFVARKHPVDYLRYYGWPSAKTYFLTDLDVIASFNEGKPEIDPVAVDWFRLPRRRVEVCSATVQGKLLAPVPWLYFLLNIAYVVAAALFLPFRSLREENRVFTGSFRLASAFLLANTFFSIFATPSVFRYQVLPTIVLFIFGVCAIAKSAPRLRNLQKLL